MHFFYFLSILHATTINNQTHNCANNNKITNFVNLDGNLLYLIAISEIDIDSAKQQNVLLSAKYTGYLSKTAAINHYNPPMQDNPLVNITQNDIDYFKQNQIKDFVIFLKMAIKKFIPNNKQLQKTFAKILVQKNEMGNYFIIRNKLLEEIEVIRQNYKNEKNTYIMLCKAVEIETLVAEYNYYTLLSVKYTENIYKQNEALLTENNLF